MMTEQQKKKDPKDVIFVTPIVDHRVVVEGSFDPKDVVGQERYRGRDSRGLLVTFRQRMLDGKVYLAYQPGEDGRINSDPQRVANAVEILRNIGKNDNVIEYEPPKNATIPRDELEQFNEWKAMKEASQKTLEAERARQADEQKGRQK